MQFSRALPLAAIAAAATIVMPAADAHGQIPPSVEFRVPKTPTVAFTDSGAVLAYELFVTNLTAMPMTLRRVEVVSAGKVLLSLSDADTSLQRATSRVTQIPVADRLKLDGGARAIVYLWVPVDRANPPAQLRHRLTLQRDTVTEVLEGTTTPVERAAVSISPPVRGEWAAFNGPSNASGHRRLVLALDGHTASGQRFAIDFLQVDSLGSSRRPGTEASKNSNYYAYGTELLAVADGVVAATKDSIPENVPGGRAVKIDLITVGGNFVGIDIGGGTYALYAHVQPGSLRVKVGDRVKRGQVIALLGNSGNSTEPHVHFQIADGPSFLAAEGLPYAADFDVLGNCGIGGNPPKITCTRHAPTAVKGGIPIQNELVRFPK
ncbi:MAG TPA: M23 family metallopeptidase [Gemmatimonadaceae bacterium]|jgi:murein DD-endopeptidase MepM/ murein hydrolase activator NlpD|nr:M23 family metallopeptidase [Gemmatimonadaceae bacterium]